MNLAVRSAPGRISAIVIPCALLLAAAIPMRAESTAPPNDESARVTDDANVTEASEAAPAAGQGAPAQTNAAADDTGWHFSVSPYLWLAGAHGNVGALGRNVGFKASIGDLLRHLRFGIMGTVEARKDWIILSNDLIYMRLSSDRALAPPILSGFTANLTADAFILNPKVGLRLINQEKIKVDAQTGFRYWYFHENVHFSPSPLGNNYSATQDWVSPVVGGRISAPLSPKLSVVIGGDAGGFHAGSQLEYQIFGLLAYQLKEKRTKRMLLVGYRYLNVDYKGSRDIGGRVNLALSGVVIGTNFDFK